jgi:hypothetical protein
LDGGLNDLMISDALHIVLVVVVGKSCSSLVIVLEASCGLKEMTVVRGAAMARTCGVGSLTVSVNAREHVPVLLLDPVFMSREDEIDIKPWLFQQHALFML